ncbi:hypothetical protein [Pedobacter caeni]|uniref:hypothetical protein n=1 Tax=Pedobacter caeni TaxID=288992 RepID=UPI00116139B8|nr:hypothetical protein [Pedobacter caeni]
MWGDKEIYTAGAIRNAEMAGEIYKDWKVVVYYDHTVPKPVILRLNELNVILKDMTGSGIYGAFWRFTVADLPDSKYNIFRDTDSRLSLREKLAVDEWMKNGDTLHLMRDHPFHLLIPYGATSPSILAGMWGIKGGAFEMTKAIKEFCMNKDDYYGIDQAFLQDVYTKFKNSITVHDDFFEKKPFPSKRSGDRFVGERIGENELPAGDEWKQIRIYNKTHYPSVFRRFKSWALSIFTQPLKK